MVQGVRGAITVEENSAEAILMATKELVETMIKRNRLKPERIAAVWLTVTNDLNAAFPAQAVRQIEGWDIVPLMCAREIPVPGSLPMCIRVMVLNNAEDPMTRPEAVYLREAVKLRPDLSRT
jgi:chorismate mutase